MTDDITPAIQDFVARYLDEMHLGRDVSGFFTLYHEPIEQVFALTVERGTLTDWQAYGPMSREDGDDLRQRLKLKYAADRFGTV